MTRPAARRPRSPGLAKGRPDRGFALLGSLLATMILGLGASATVRWSALLMSQDRDQQVRFHALQRLHNALETGQPDDVRSPAPGGDGRVVTVPGGASIRMEIRDRPPSLDGEPAVGRHRRLTAHWIDAKGVSQRLDLHTFWHPSPRIY